MRASPPRSARPHRWVALAVAACAFGRPSLAAAEPSSISAPSLSESLSGDAKRDYESAKLLYADSDFAGALVKFRLAYDESRDPRLLWNEAVCEKSLRHYAKVAALVHRVLAEGGPLLTDAARGEASELLRALEPLTARLQLTIHPDGASVYVDGELVGVTPLRDAPLVDLGSRQLRIVKDGYKEATTSLVIGGAAVVAREISLERIVHQGVFTVQGAAADAIAIDGRMLGLGRWQGPLASGVHALRVTSAGKKAFETEFVLQDNEARSIDVSLQDEPRSGGIPTWAWIAGGGAVLAGAAIGAYVLFKPADATAGPSVVGTIAPGTVQLASYR